MKLKKIKKSIKKAVIAFSRSNVHGIASSAAGGTHFVLAGAAARYFKVDFKVALRAIYKSSYAVSSYFDKAAIDASGFYKHLVRNKY